MRPAARLVVLVMLVACTGESSPPVATSSVSTSLSALARVVPDVVGENFLEALVALKPQFRLLDIKHRISSDVPNGTILRQRPAAGSPFDSTKPEITIRVVVSRSTG